MILETRRLKLALQSVEEVRASIQQMPPEHAAQLSSEWLALVQGASVPDPWIHGFIVWDREKSMVVGQCGFKGPPREGWVEIAYAIEPVWQGRGYATEAASAMVEFAFAQRGVEILRAHTLPEANASTRVLTKAGFEKVGEVMDPDDGLVWRWERTKTSAKHNVAVSSAK